MTFHDLRRSIGRRPALFALFLAGCGGGNTDTPAFDSGLVFADASVPDGRVPPPDAPVIECDDITFEPGDVFAAGGDDSFYNVGPGAYVATQSSHALPGEILYVEMFHQLLMGATSLTLTAFVNWIQCDMCIFLGTECPAYDLTFNAQSMEVAAPTQCGTLYMLERGQIDLSSLDTDRYRGTLSGTISPVAGEDRITLVEVFKDWQGSAGMFYGDKVDYGKCVTLPGLSFSGTWDEPLPDAGVPDAGPVDARPADAGPDASPAVDAVPGPDAT